MNEFLKAEMARQRGMFDEAISLLDYSFDDNYSEAVEAMKILCENKIVCIADIQRVLNIMNQ